MSISVAQALACAATIYANFGRRTPNRLKLVPLKSNHWRVMREPGWMPKPLPPRGTPLGKTPLPLEGKGAGPVAPPPATAVGGAPKETGSDGSDPMYCE